MTELEKCKIDLYYFYCNYFYVNGKPVICRDVDKFIMNNGI